MSTSRCNFDPRYPITVSKVKGQWLLIDGRNRRETCRQAGITPHYRIFEGDAYEIKAFILDTDNRRHLTKGQQAMAVALAYPEPEKGGRGKNSSLNKEFISFSAASLSQARFVLRHCLEKAEEVLSNPYYPLTKAYEDVQANPRLKRLAVHLSTALWIASVPNPKTAMPHQGKRQWLQQWRFLKQNAGCIPS